MLPGRRPADPSGPPDASRVPLGENFTQPLDEPEPCTDRWQSAWRSVVCCETPLPQLMRDRWPGRHAHAQTGVVRTEREQLAQTLNIGSLIKGWQGAM